MKLITKTEFGLYSLIAISIILAIVAVVFIYLKFWKKKKEEVITFDFSDLLEALGGRDNIIETSNVQKRVKIILKDVKSVSANALRKLEIAAFLKQNELTFIYKDNVEELVKFLGSGEWYDIKKVYCYS